MPRPSPPLPNPTSLAGKTLPITSSSRYRPDRPVADHHVGLSALTPPLERVQPDGLGRKLGVTTLKYGKVGRCYEKNAKLQPWLSMASTWAISASTSSGVATVSATVALKTSRKRLRSRWIATRAAPSEVLSVPPSSA